MGTILPRLMQAMNGATASLLGALLVSTALTAAVVVPMGTQAVVEADLPPGLDEGITVDDTRFPSPAPLGEIELAILNRQRDSPDDEVALGQIEATATPEPRKSDAAPEVAGLSITPGPSEAGATSEPDEAEVDGTPPTVTTPLPDVPEDSPTVFPTPTTGTPSAPTSPPQPTPTATTVTATPTPLAPSPTATLAATPFPPTPTPEVATDGIGPLASPTPEGTGDEIATDVAASVAGGLLVRDETGIVEVRAINRGDQHTTDVAMTLTVSGATILSVVPLRADWTCSGSGTRWVCAGDQLEAQTHSRAHVTILSTAASVNVSMTVSHAILDLVPDNDSVTANIEVTPQP